MPPCFFALAPSSPSISKFISEQPYLSMLENNCTSMKDLKKIHAQLIKTALINDPIAASRVLAFSATSPASDINYAFLFFNQMKIRNLFAWNTMIRGFSQSSTPENAIFLFIDMLVNSGVEPCRLTYPSVFKAYTRIGLARDGAQLHGRVIKLGLDFDTYVRNAVIHMYASCGVLSEARKLFDEDKVVDAVTWNSMIMGLAKCGEIDDSRKLFDKMPLRTDVSWNSMISGYVRNGKWVEALELFRRMQYENIEPSEFTLVSLLNACARLGALEQGEWICNYIKKKKIDLNVIVVTAIIDMYCKCGSVQMAREAFETAPIKGLSSWNSMVLGLANNGFGKEAIQMFSRLESSNLEPDSVSFIGVLIACNHSGLVETAKYYFTLMREKYEIEPSIKHYGCLIDTLGRAGLLEEAEEIIRSMPMEPDAAIWGSLLSACRAHGDMEMAKWAARNLNELDAIEGSGYVSMSNMYAASGDYQKAIEERISMKEKQIKKQPGCSLIEVNGEVHEFVAGGMLHSELQEIQSLLEGLGEIVA
nr:pentatricopeptide repeat-containing protein At2g42920, chloroplastic [Ipomoea trifida]